MGKIVIASDGVMSALDNIKMKKMDLFILNMMKKIGFQF